ncbi:helix-turn-helix domain-containing protein [Flavobacterium sp. UBA6135]|uniref:helix-turn-helix domain-containing protein n=1 Tax=Flavobacterium sp. UBA6135 TaxID=1946553 RepID=UPI0025C6C26B|nr:helix-turn-helix transcriptional regulator [Flavobacterium sp. UBA6135]
MYQNSYNKNWYAMTDAVVVQTLCSSLKQMRLNKNISQEELAERCGLSRITISRMESGKAINLLTMVQVMRALGKLDLLNHLNEEPEISPLQVMEERSKYRKKASPSK